MIRFCTYLESEKNESGIFDRHIFGIRTKRNAFNMKTIAGRTPFLFNRNDFRTDCDNMFPPTCSGQIHPHGCHRDSKQQQYVAKRAPTGENPTVELVPRNIETAQWPTKRIR